MSGWMAKNKVNRMKSWKIIPTYMKWVFILSLLAAVGTDLTNRVFLAYGKINQGQTMYVCVWERETAWRLTISLLVPFILEVCRLRRATVIMRYRTANTVCSQSSVSLQRHHIKYSSNRHTDTFRRLCIDTYCTYPCLRFPIVVLPKL